MAKERVYSRDYKVDKATATRLKYFLTSTLSPFYLDCGQSDFEVYRGRQEQRNAKALILNGGLETEIILRGLNSQTLSLIRQAMRDRNPRSKQ